MNQPDMRNFKPIPDCRHCDNLSIYHSVEIDMYEPPKYKYWCDSDCRIRWLDDNGYIWCTGYKPKYCG